MPINTFTYTAKELCLMPRRVQSSDKSFYGRLLLVCGSVGMSGAAFLSAKAALRTGAGLVEILTPEENRVILQTLLPEAIVTAYDKDALDKEKISERISRADAVVCGCGLGVYPYSRQLLSFLLHTCAVPTVLDADALNLLSRNPSLLKHTEGKIITPHIGEFSRLCGEESEKIKCSPDEYCRAFAEKHSLVCVLKGHRTVVSDGGERLYLNNAGNSGMATAGSGDVLAGIIGGILAQNKHGSLDALTAASLGVYIHSLCGDHAAAGLGEYSLMASDIIDALPSVLRGIKQ